MWKKVLAVLAICCLFNVSTVLVAVSYRIIKDQNPFQNCLAFNSLEKALRIAVRASNNGAYLCQNSEEQLKKCTETRPLVKLNQHDVTLIKSKLLDSSLDVELVEKITSKTFAKMTEDKSMETIFVASVSDGR